MKQGEIWYANLNPSEGREQAGFRPVVIISGDMLNQYLDIVIFCPLTSQVKNYKGNVILKPNKTNQLKKKSEVLTFHIRSVSKNRLMEKVGKITKTEINQVKVCLNDILKY